MAKFHKQLGTNLNRFPSVDKRPLDLYRLKKAVEVRGGFQKVCKLKKWAEIGRDLGYSGKIMSSLSTSLKNSYQRWLNPYEEYLRLAKPGVQQKLEHEHGGPLTPSPADSPLKRSHQGTPGHGALLPADERAFAALQTTLREYDAEERHAPRPIQSSGFTPVNPAGASAFSSPAASFTAVNASNGVKAKADDKRTPPRSAIESPLSSALNTPEHPARLSDVSNGTASNRMKRKVSPENREPVSQQEQSTISNGDGEDGERRSKRLKKGMPLIHPRNRFPLSPQTPPPPPGISWL